METVADYKEIVDEIKANGGEAFKLCYQCGLCDAVCPWNRVRTFSMRKIVGEATFGMTDIESDDIWLCSTCGLCSQQCPRDVRQIESGVALRRMATEYGVFTTTAKPVRGVAASLTAVGNPLNEKRQDRAKWTEGHSVKPFTAGMEYLYLSCCYLSYDARLKKVAAATANVLNQAGVDYGILGTSENCCGESIRKTGDEDLFKRLAKGNIKTFVDSEVKKILVSSPHCYQAFKNEYPEFMVNFEVVHVTQLLADLIKEGRLALNNEYAKKVAYHDPCYLGRHNGVYDEPRDVLSAVPGLELIEMYEAREASLCCGGGGGRIWMETMKGQRFSDLRIAQAIDAGAEVLASACPYCITHFEESRLTLKDNESLVVKDIAEIIQEAI